jgi:GNAT superfamily N-acetyltransferase
MSAAALAIRRATPADACAIGALLASLAHCCTVHPDGRGAERFYSAISAGALAAFIASPAYHYLVGELGGELAGVIALRDNSHLFHLFVDARYQGQGLASKLWTHLKEHAIDAGNPGEFTVNASLGAVPVYRRFGFASLSGPIIEDGISYVRMRYPGKASYIAEGEDS